MSYIPHKFTTTGTPGRVGASWAKIFRRLIRNICLGIVPVVSWGWLAGRHCSGRASQSLRDSWLSAATFGKDSGIFSYPPVYCTIINNKYTGGKEVTLPSTRRWPLH